VSGQRLAANASRKQQPANRMVREEAERLRQSVHDVKVTEVELGPRPPRCLQHFVIVPNRSVGCAESNSCEKWLK
jgi:hypothetical protein